MRWARARYGPGLMESEQAQHLEHLKRLAAELGRQGFSTRLLDAGQPARLKVTNPDSHLNEQVQCRQDEHGAWWFCWPWGQAIAPADDPGLVTRRISTVLRAVESTP
jgi:hypothetical protein